jgi:lipid-A-disaccharide synthase-like uncharacterized protein
MNELATSFIIHHSSFDPIHRSSFIVHRSMSFHLELNPASWHWDLIAAFGFLAQAIFAMRFIIQWIASERRRVSHIPLGFWWLSLSGGVLMTMYGLLRRDPVIILGQAPGLVVYVRNLMLIYRHAERRTTEDAPRDRAAVD